jgi:hypothetical protein
MIRSVVILCIMITALDGVESLISKTSHVPYARFMFVQIIVYVGIGFALRRRAWPLGRVALAVAVTALFEATIGEWLAVSMQASPAVPIALYAFVVPIVIVVECGLAATGWALGSIGRTARS